MSRMRPMAERSMPMEERQSSTDLTVERGVERKWGFRVRALWESTLRWFSR